VSRTYRFSLVTNCVWPTDQLNQDIELGDWRPLDVRLEPFSEQAAAVYSFKAPILDSIRQHRRRRAWKKVVLLLQQRQ
jgi:hypothetical protein